jgi:SAM-dependent methyltransferase
VSRKPPQRYISARCEEDLHTWGDSFRGVGYTKSAQEAQDRYAVMLEVVREPQENVSLLDLGCGLAHMLDHIQTRPDRGNIRYTGLDISEEYLETAKARHPDADLVLLDVLQKGDDLPQYDYVVLNGVFNWRGELEWESMLQYCEQMLGVAFAHCRRGIAFNVMSKIVDWERDDLFHLPFDVMARIVSTNLSRHFVVRHDYDAYEYTTYVYRVPTAFPT